MHTTRSPFPLLFFLPLFAHAQETLSPPLNDHAFYGPIHFDNAQDSEDFIQFHNGLQRVETTLPSDTTTISYRMVWREDQHGGTTMVTRGDGSVRKASESIAFSLYELMSLPYRAAEGMRRVRVSANA